MTTDRNPTLRAPGGPPAPELFVDPPRIDCVYRKVTVADPEARTPGFVSGCRLGWVRNGKCLYDCPFYRPRRPLDASFA